MQVLPGHARFFRGSEELRSQSRCGAAPDGSRTADRLPQHGWPAAVGESTALPLSHSFSQTNLKSPCAEQVIGSQVSSTDGSVSVDFLIEDSEAPAPLNKSHYLTTHLAPILMKQYA